MAEKRDFKADPDRGPVAAARLHAAGLRVQPIDPNSKAATRKGNRKDNPTFSVPPEEFRASELVAVLMGPCPLGNWAGGRWLSGFDLDGEFDHARLEARLGRLPPTLSSKNGRHLYFWLPPTLPGREDIRQGNDIFRSKAKTGGALDWRPCAGGYFLERGDWDGDFDATRIADLPESAWSALTAVRAKLATPIEPCKIPADWKGPEWDESDRRRMQSIAAALGGVWPAPGAGGGHDLALAMGGILADAELSEDEAVQFCAWIWDAAEAPYQVSEVVTSMILRRAPGKPRAVFGWPKLRGILLEHNDPNDVKRALARLSEVPGLTPPRFIFARPPKEKPADV